MEESRLKIRSSDLKFKISLTIHAGKSILNSVEMTMTINIRKAINREAAGGAGYTGEALADSLVLCPEM